MNEEKLFRDCFTYLEVWPLIVTISFKTVMDWSHPALPNSRIWLTNLAQHVSMAYIWSSFMVSWFTIWLLGAREGKRGRRIRTNWCRHWDHSSHPTCTLPPMVSVYVVWFVFTDERMEQVLWERGRESNQGVTRERMHGRSDGRWWLSRQTPNKAVIRCNPFPTPSFSMTWKNWVSNHCTPCCSERGSRSLTEVVVTSSGSHNQQACKDASRY